MRGQDARATYLPFAFFLKLFDLALDDATFDRAHSFNEYLAVKMIVFVQNASRGQLNHFHSVLFAFDILKLDQHLVSTADFFKESWKAQTAFFTVLLTGGFNNDRIDQRDSLIRILAGAAIHHKYARRFCNL